MDPSAISDQVDRILRSQSFANKSQLKRLLEVLHKNMDSQTTLRPEHIIQELWPGEIKTKRSADVATEMNRLRRALQSYYEGEGKADPIAINLPNRSTPAANGAPEKRWIVAKPRRDAEDDALNPQANPRRTSRYVAVFAVLGGLAIASYVSIRVLSVPGQPQSARLDGSSLVILNPEGRELWRKAFPDGFGPDWYYAQGLTERIWFGDLEGHGQTSVLFAYSPATNRGPHSTMLICYSARGKEKWRWTPGKELLSGRECAHAAPTAR